MVGSLIELMVLEDFSETESTMTSLTDAAYLHYHWGV